MAGGQGSGGAAAGMSAAGAPSGACSKPHAAGRQDVTLTIGQFQRNFLVYVPSSYQGSVRVPLVFNLHGTGGDPAGQQDDTQMEAAADQHGFVVVALAGYQSRWNVSLAPTEPDDIALTEQAISWANSNLCIDAQRLYATGFSGGARLSSRLACALPGTFAAIAPIAGVRNDPPCATVPTPLMTVHGTADMTNFYLGCPAADTGCSRNGEWAESVEAALGDWVTLNGCSSTPLITASGAAELLTYQNCTGDAEVLMYRVAGGAHDWNHAAEHDRSHLAILFATLALSASIA